MNDDWRTTFLERFLSRQSTDHQAARDLKAENLPRVLYKFYPPTEYAFDNLCNGELWLAAPATFNDPYDCSFVVDLPSMLFPWARSKTLEGRKIFDSVTDDELESLFADTAQPALVARILAPFSKDGVRRLILDLASFPIMRTMAANNPGLSEPEKVLQLGLKVACFTEHAASMLLWSHYAREHRGFCLEYATDNFAPWLRVALYPVYYGQERFSFPPNLDDRVRARNCGIAAALHKASDWKYEHEWRAVLAFDQHRQGLARPIATPRAAHAGLRMSPVDRKRLNEVCAHRGIPVHDVTLPRTRYEIIVKPPT